MHTTFQVVQCPHCGKCSVVTLDTTRFHLLDVHLNRKPFDELQAREFERDYHCDTCQKSFYVTLRRRRRVSKPVKLWG